MCRYCVLHILFAGEYVTLPLALKKRFAAAENEELLIEGCAGREVYPGLLVWILNIGAMVLRACFLPLGVGFGELREVRC